MGNDGQLFEPLGTRPREGVVRDSRRPGDVRPPGSGGPPELRVGREGRQCVVPKRRVEDEDRLVRGEEDLVSLETRNLGRVERRAVLEQSLHFLLRSWLDGNDDRDVA